MLRSLLKIINAEPGEEKPVLLLLGNGFFIGIFLASYKIVAYTLFLSHLGEYLREAMFLSGGLGIMSTGLYAFAQRRMPFSRLIIINYVTIFIFIALARVSYVYSEKEWVIFALYVMHMPIMSILLLGFWGTFGRIFDLRQSKRIIGGIDSGQLTATIIAFFTIPLLVNYLSDLSDLLIIGEVGIVISCVFLVVIISNFNLNFYDTHKTKRLEESRMRSLVKNKYVVYLALFLFFSMMAFSFVEYSFLNVAEAQFPEENKLLSFISVIEASVLVIGLLIQTFVNERLISMYGLKTTLLVLPIILAIFTALAIFSGYYFGYEDSGVNFIWFFLFITISKLFTSSLREAMENPVFKLFFMPLDDRVRFDIQTRVEGMVNEVARLLGGALIFFFGLFSFIELIHYSVFLVLIIVGWIFLALRIYQNYRVSIRYKLERQKRRAGREITRHSKNYVFNILVESTKSQQPEKLIFSFKIMAKLFPFEFQMGLKKHLSNKDQKLKKLIVNKLKEDGVLNNEELYHETRELRGEEYADHAMLEGKSIEEVIDLLKTARTDFKKATMEYVANVNPYDGFKIIIELLNDTNSEVVNLAILTSGKIKRNELLPFLVDFLTKEKYRDSATDSLINYGEKAFGSLETAFFATDQAEDVKIRIIGIYGRVGGSGAIKYLWNKIDYPDFKITSAVLYALSQCGFKAHGQQIARIKTALENDISNILWNLIAIEKLNREENKHYEMLYQALQEENMHNYSHIYMLLSMIFDQQSIQLVKENIESRTNEGVTYALELLDVFLPEDIKQKIIPILDDIPESERVKRLQIFFPQIELETHEILKAIVNRDYSQTNRWTKACAFYSLRFVDSTADYSLELVANLFNPDELLRETAAWTLYLLYPDVYRKNIGRLPEDQRQTLNNKIMEPFENEDIADLGGRYFRYSLIEFLKNSSSLKMLSGLFLSQMVDRVEEFRVNRDFEVDLVSYRTNYFFFILKGEVVLFDANYNVEKKFDRGSYLGEFIFSGMEKRDFKLFMKEGTVLLQIEKNRYYDLVCNEFDTLERILERLDTEPAEEESLEIT